MIYNRTQADVDESIRIRREKVQTFQELTEEEKAILERGMMTIDTLNRIEEKQIELKELFRGMGYFCGEIQSKTWDYTQIFNVDEFERILKNTVALRNAFFVFSETPPTPHVSFHYNDINALEKILHDLDVMINGVKSNYRYCGEFICGE
jgi:hypothetical protein